MVTRASAKSNGRRWERWVGTFMEPVWPHWERRAKAGRQDKGDLINTEDWTIECKAVRSIDLAEFIDQAKVERTHTGTRWCAAVVKRRSKPTGNAYVVMELAQFRDIVAYIKELEHT